MKDENKAVHNKNTSTIYYTDAKNLGRFVSESIEKHKKAPSSHIVVKEVFRFVEGPPDSGEIVLCFDPAPTTK